MSRRLAALLRATLVLALAAAAACSRKDASGPLQVFDLGPVAEGVASRDPVLRLRDGELELEYVAAGERRARAWPAGADRLGAEHAAGGDETDPHRSGRLDAERVRAALDASSPALRNGRLFASGAPLGWAPDAAAEPTPPGEPPTGRTVLVYDRRVADGYDVVFRDADGAEVALAAGPRFEAHPSLAVDRSGRIWAAWDEGGERWGEGGPLHRSRTLRLAVFVGGAWRRGPELPPDEVLFADAGRGASAVELPRLVADEDGPLWLFHRVMTRWPDPDGKAESSNRRVSWHVQALVLGADGWLGPIALPDSDGPNHDTLAVMALPGGGVAAAVESDGRRARIPAVRTWDAALGTEPAVHAIELSAAGGGTPSAGGAPLDLGPPRPLPAGPRHPDPDPELVPAGTVRLWGDLHRHSDGSRCKMDLDGTVFDQLRYALDVEGLDFLAITDHFQHLTQEDWDFRRRTVEAFHEPGRFLPLHGFERAVPNGHWTMVCGDEAAAEVGPFLPYRGRDPWADLDPAWLAIPHQLADRAAPLHWKNYDPHYEPVVELFQSRRGSYECPHGPWLDFGVLPDWPLATDYLERGRKLGFVASSDHETTGRAFTAVLARDRTRAAVIEALRARRCYAATARLALDVRLGGLVMGEEGEAPPDAPLVVRVDGGSELARVEVVRGGAVVRSWDGDDPGRGLLTLRLGRSEGRREARLAFTGAEPGVPLPLVGEGEDELRAAGGALILSADLDLRDEDGLTVELALAPDAAVELSVDGESRAFTRAELEAGTEGLTLARAKVELRLDPAPLGASRLEAEYAPGDWGPGDWVYVRAVRTDGAVAWSSPIFVR